MSSHAGGNASLQDTLKASLHEASPQEYELEAEVPGSSKSGNQPGIFKQGPGAVIECWRSAGKPPEALEILLPCAHITPTL